MKSSDPSPSSTQDSAEAPTDPELITKVDNERWKGPATTGAIDIVVLFLGFVAFGFRNVSQLAPLELALAGIGCTLLLAAYALWFGYLSFDYEATRGRIGKLPKLLHDAWIAARILLIVAVVVAFGMQLSREARTIWACALLAYGCIACADAFVRARTAKRFKARQ